MSNFQILLEKDLRPQLIKRGLPQELADWAHDVSNKFSGFVANVAFFDDNQYLNDHYIKYQSYLLRLNAIKNVIENLFENPVKPKLPVKPNTLTLANANDLLNELAYIMDWANDPERTDKSNIANLSWSEAKQKSDEYHEEQAKKADNTKTLEIKSHEKVIFKFPDGFYWLNLNRSYCRDEADVMGHCGNASEGEKLYSLRDRQGRPYITASLNKDDEMCSQIYGRANTTPLEKYHEKILTLLGELNITKVKKQSYGEGSLDVEEDISDGLKEWFEDKYNYYPSKGGISDADIKRGDEIINDVNNKILYSGVHIDHSDEYISAFINGFLNFPYLETDEDFWETDLGKIISEKVDDKFYNFEVNDYGASFSGSDNSPSYDGETDNGYDSNGGSYTNYIDWVRAVATEAKDFNDEIKKLVDDVFENFFFSNETDDEEDEDEDTPKIPKNTLLFLQSFNNFKSEISKQQPRDHYYDLSWTFAENLIASIHLFKKDEWLGSTPVISEESLSELQNSIKNTLKKTFEYENSTFLHNPETNASIIDRLSSSELEEFINKLDVKVKQNVDRGYNRYKPLLEIDIQLIPINDNSQKEWLNLYYTQRVSEAIEHTIDKFYNNISIKKENYSFMKYYNFKYNLLGY
jgi:hypothetical protein